jgi:phenylacetic acid degradation operon negative regulatory protein
MKSKSELLLYHMFWIADCMMSPSIHRIGQSFEEWAYKNGFLRQVQELERRGFLESDPAEKGGKRVLRLTRRGVLRALGGAEPSVRWNRPWDGQWRMVMFDLPEKNRALRNSLRNELRAARFGCLQGSVWLTPDPVDSELGKFMEKCGEACRTILFFSGRPCDGASDADLVKSAWNFTAIDAAYRDYRSHLKNLPRSGAEIRTRLLDWGNRERDLWDRCLKLDPLLPRQLWPRGYKGESAWQERLRAMKAAGNIAAVS